MATTTGLLNNAWFANNNWTDEDVESYYGATKGSVNSYTMKNSLNGLSGNTNPGQGVSTSTGRAAQTEANPYTDPAAGVSYRNGKYFNANGAEVSSEGAPLSAAPASTPIVPAATPTPAGASTPIVPAATPTPAGGTPLASLFAYGTTPAVHTTETLTSPDEIYHGEMSHTSDGPDNGNTHTVTWIPETPATTSPVSADNPTSGNPYTAVLNQKVDPATTLNGLLGTALARDENGNYISDLVRQSVDRANQTFNSRGLLNSSLAAQAGQEAAISKAIEIAGPDAQRYFEQSINNQNASNSFAQQYNAYGYSSALQAQQGAITAARDATLNGYTTDRDNNLASITTARDTALFGYDMTKITAQLDNSLAQTKLTVEASVNNAQLSADTQVGINQANIEGASVARNSSSAASLLSDYNTNVRNIVESDLTPEAKDAAIKQYGTILKNAMSLIGSINGDVDFNSYFDQLFADVKVDSNPSAETTGMQKFSPEQLATVVAEANSRATANGTTPEQELYKQAKIDGLTNAQIDIVMGFPPGTTDKWLAANPQ